jgi:hypothetical protein
MKDENKNQASSENIDDLEIDSGENQGFIGVSEDDKVIISKTKILLMKKILGNIKTNNEKLMDLLAVFINPEDESRLAVSQMADENFADQNDEESGKIIEGVFDGEHMIGPDGKQYSIPANYASKSKLVEGDILKLTITGNGTFIYKQIGPIDRIRVVGRLEKVSDGSYFIVADGKKWKVLGASITYFKASPGDEVVILIPKTGESNWAAVENVVKNV